MTPKPDLPDRLGNDAPLEKSAVNFHENVEPDSDGSDDLEGGNYGYHLIDQEPVQHGDDDDDDEDLSHLSIQEQAQALARQAQSTQENLSPDVQKMISESEEKQRLEAAKEVSQVWKEEKAGRGIEMNQQKVQTIKSIMSNISLPTPVNFPSWLNKDSPTDLGKLVMEAQKSKQ